MILSEVGNYVKSRQRVSLEDISRHFNAQSDAARAMLDLWIKKGRIQRHTATTSCGSSCQQCSPASTEIYIWVDTGTPFSSQCISKA